MKTVDYKNYVGDIHLEYGGVFINLDDWKWGYAECLRVIDLDSAVGFDGAIMVEHITVNIDAANIRSSRDFCGYQRLGGGTADDRKITIISCLVESGYYDVVEDFQGPHRWVIQTYPDGKTEYDGWEADIVLEDGQDILGYLEDEGYMRNFE